MAGYVCIFVMLHPIEKFEWNVWPTQYYRKNGYPNYHQSNYDLCSNYQKTNLVIQLPEAKYKVTPYFAVHNDQVMKWSEPQQSSHKTSVQFSSVTQSCLTPWIAALQASLSITNSLSLLKLMSIESVMPSNHLILYYPLLLLPSIFPSIRALSNESALCIRWPNYWSFSFNISPSNEHPGLISFRMDWLDLLAIQGTFQSLLQHHSSKASILLCSAFFIVELSHPYMITGKTIASTKVCHRI